MNFDLKKGQNSHYLNQDKRLNMIINSGSFCIWYKFNNYSKFSFHFNWIFWKLYWLSELVLKKMF